MLYLRSKKYLISVKNAATKEELMVAHVLKAMEFAVNVNKLIYKFYNKKSRSASAPRFVSHALISSGRYGILFLLIR